MKKRLQALMHTGKALSALIEGHLSSPDARADLVKLATAACQVPRAPSPGNCRGTRR